MRNHKHRWQQRGHDDLDECAQAARSKRGGGFLDILLKILQHRPQRAHDERHSDKGQRDDHRERCISGLDAQRNEETAQPAVCGKQAGQRQSCNSGRGSANGKSTSASTKRSSEKTGNAPKSTRASEPNTAFTKAARSEAVKVSRTPRRASGSVMSLQNSAHESSKRLSFRNKPAMGIKHEHAQIQERVAHRQPEAGQRIECFKPFKSSWDSLWLMKGVWEVLVWVWGADGGLKMGGDGVEVGFSVV